MSDPIGDHDGVLQRVTENTPEIESWQDEELGLVLSEPGNLGGWMSAENPLDITESR